MSRSAVPAEPDALDPVDGLTRVLAKACRALGDAGHPQEAAALAAQGWTIVRKVHPKQADRLDGAMHYLARLEAKQEAGAPTTSAVE